MQKKMQKESPDYLALPSKVSQQVLIILDKNWKSFFALIKDWKKNPSKYEGRPKLPKYKHKENGRNVVIYDAQAISKRALDKGKIQLSRTNIAIDYQHQKCEVKQARIVYVNQYLYRIEIVYIKECKEEKRGSNFIGIDFGLSNLCTIATNDLNSFIIDGNPLKAMNNYYNKKKAKLMSYIGDKGSSNRIVKLTNKRNNKIDDYLHKTSRYIIDYCLTNDVGEIIIGYNKGWKNGVNLGKKNNQKFVSIPYLRLLNQIKYKAEMIGIDVVVQEESYTSKCSFFDNEPICKHESYQGKRIKRGLFRTSSGKILNADVNGGLNIMRKCNPQFNVNNIFERIKGFSVSPQRTCPLKQVL